MNVYDFDDTILAGDTEWLFFTDCLSNPEISKKNKRRVKWLFFLSRFSKPLMYKKCKNAYDIVFDIKDLDAYVEKFWDERMYLIKPFYAKQQKEDDIISSATPRFLVEPIIKRLGVKTYFATELDPKTMKLSFLNKGEGKVESFKKQFLNAEIDEFYSDSDNDLPLARLAKKPFKVTGESIVSWDIK